LCWLLGLLVLLLLSQAEGICLRGACFCVPAAVAFP
jgi:hypothetical protein